MIIQTNLSKMKNKILPTCLQGNYQDSSQYYIIRCVSGWKSHLIILTYLVVSSGITDNQQTRLPKSWLDLIGEGAGSETASNGTCSCTASKLQNGTLQDKLAGEKQFKKGETLQPSIVPLKKNNNKNNVICTNFIKFLKTKLGFQRNFRTFCDIPRSTKLFEGD